MWQVVDPRPLPLGTAIWIVDLGGMGLSDLGSEAFQFFKRMSVEVGMHYPERLYKYVHILATHLGLLAMSSNSMYSISMLVHSCIPLGLLQILGIREAGPTLTMHVAASSKQLNPSCEWGEGEPFDFGSANLPHL